MLPVWTQLRTSVKRVETSYYFFDGVYFGVAVIGQYCVYHERGRGCLSQRQVVQFEAEGVVEILVAATVAATVAAMVVAVRVVVESANDNARWRRGRCGVGGSR